MEEIMGEARQKANEGTKLFEPPLPARVAISRPGARPVSARKYEQCLSEWKADTLCFNFNCSNKLLAPPDVYMILLQEENVAAIILGVCSQCAQYSNDELLTLVRDQYGNHYGLDQQAPTDSAKVALAFPPGIGFNIAGVSLFMPGRKKPSIPGGPNVFADLLEAGRLPEYMTVRRGISNCHGITGALYRDLDDAGWAQRFVFKRGSCEVLKSKHDPDGLHSWLEINGWAIDAANGANRPVIIMPTDAYYNMPHITNACAIPETEGGQENIQ
jgi:hypothetical protein